MNQINGNHLQTVPDAVHQKKYVHGSYFVMVEYHLILSISFRVTSLALGQSYDCPSTSEATLEDRGKLIS